MHLLILRLLAVALLFVSPAIRTDDRGDFHWQGTVPAGKTVEIKGVNGGIEAVPATGGELQVTARKTARHSDPASVQIKLVEHPDGITVCAVYPGRGGRANECAAGEGGHMDVDNNDVNVDFTVRVPEGVNLVASTVNGGVEASDLAGDVRVHTVNGGIKLSCRGTASAETVNGSINAAIGEGDGTGDVRFNTVNGGITLAVPAGFDAEVRADTLNGSIETDLAGLTSTHRHRTRMTGTLGRGGRNLRLETVNGSIHLQGR